MKDKEYKDAWQTLKEDYIKNYIQACKEDRSLVQKQHYALVICAMDCYDGKNELDKLGICKENE